MPTIQEADQCIVPLLQGDELRPSILGTAVFCRVADQHFLVTAAHVLDDRETISFGRGIILGNASTTAVRTALPSTGNRDDDILDLAVLRLTVDQSQRLDEQGRRPILVDDWEVDDLAQPGQRYVFCGFPASGMDRDRPRRILEPIRVSANCIALSAEKVARLGLHTTTHAVGQFRRRRMRTGNGRIGMAPDPHGMSGGPVWTFRPNSDQLVWVGVGIEYRSHECVFIGTRLGAVVALMRTYFPDVAAHLRESRFCQFIVAP
jgi:hypothetical protein